MYKLYDYWRSSCSWRVRWALYHKGLNFESVGVSLLDDAQNSLEHKQRNPRGKVPVLEVLEGGRLVTIGESIAILEWLEESHPTPALLPNDAFERARVRELVQYINSGIHPLQNLVVLKKISDDVEVRKKWAQHWIQDGLVAFEKRVSQTAGEYCMGDEITHADLCLVPQVYNAKRFDLTLEGLPIIQKIFENAAKTAAYQKSHPDQFQPKA